MKNWVKKLVIYVLLYFLILPTYYAYATSSNQDLRQFHDLVEGTHKLGGLFTLYHHQDSSKTYWEIQPEQLNKNYLAIVTLESGLGEKGIYSGLPLGNFLFYFQRINDHLHFVVRNVKFSTDLSLPEQRSLARSFSDSVLYSLKIDTIHPISKSILIDLDNLLMQDVPGLTPLLKSSLQADYYLEPRKSYFSDINSFPANLEIEAIYGFSSEDPVNLVTIPDSRALALKVHYSFSQLPENHKYTPRLADDRVGYFITALRDFSNNPESYVRYIHRWHLEPSDPTAPLSPPKQPIVFWIENTVPLAYREAIRSGVLMWNKAFTQAGFQNALEVREMPDDANWQPADVRYNTIRWFNALDAGFARSLVHINPLTGEILDADIIVDSDMVRLIEQQSQLWSPPGKPCLMTDNDLCYGQESLEQAAMGATVLSLLDTPQLQEYVQQYLQFLIAHEVGHTLGLRHNFHGSTMLSPQELNNWEITHTKGLVGSVMDYLPANIAPQGVPQGDYFPLVVGPYDQWAIEYGYRTEPMVLESIQPELSYATDEDIWDINPLANTWDMSSDVLLYSQWQMDNARVIWQRLEAGYPSRGESHSHLRSLFNWVLKYYFRQATLLSQYIGGESFHRGEGSGEGTWIFPSLLKQRQALAKLQEYVFAEDAFRFSPQLLNQLAPSPWQYWGSSRLQNRLDYPIHERILSWQSTILRSLLDSVRLYRLQDLELKTLPGEALSIPELFDTLQQGIWTEVFTPKEPKLISSLRRSLQREYLDILLAMVLDTTDAPEDGRTMAWYKLHQLQRAINTQLREFGGQLDIYTLAHLKFSNDLISKALDAD
jgi:hypothetical protein